VTASAIAYARLTRRTRRPRLRCIIGRRAGSSCSRDHRVAPPRRAARSAVDAVHELLVPPSPSRWNQRRRAPGCLPRRLHSPGLSAAISPGSAACHGRRRGPERPNCGGQRHARRDPLSGVDQLITRQKNHSGEVVRRACIDAAVAEFSGLPSLFAPSLTVSRRARARDARARHGGRRGERAVSPR